MGKGNAGDRVAELLKEHRMVLVRDRKHQCWKHPDGRTFVMSSSPSDGMAAAQQLRSLEKFLGIQKERGKPGERRDKKAKKKTRVQVLVVGTGKAGETLQEQLRSIYGVSQSESR